MPELIRSYPKRPPSYYADRARARRAVLAAVPTRPSVDDVFAHVNDDDGYIGAMPRPSTWLRSEGGAR